MTQQQPEAVGEPTDPTVPSDNDPRNGVSDGDAQRKREQDTRDNDDVERPDPVEQDDPDETYVSYIDGDGKSQRVTAAKFNDLARRGLA